MNSSTITLSPNAARNAITLSAKPITAAQIRRTLARKWDFYAVIGLIASSAAYGVYALAHCGLA